MVHWQLYGGLMKERRETSARVFSPSCSVCTPNPLSRLHSVCSSDSQSPIEPLKYSGYNEYDPSPTRCVPGSASRIERLYARLPKETPGAHRMRGGYATPIGPNWQATDPSPRLATMTPSSTPDPQQGSTTTPSSLITREDCLQRMLEASPRAKVYLNPQTNPNFSHCKSRMLPKPNCLNPGLSNGKGTGGPTERRNDAEEDPSTEERPDRQQAQACP